MATVTIDKYGGVTVEANARRAFYAPYGDMPRAARLSPDAPLATHFANYFIPTDVPGIWEVVASSDGPQRPIANAAWRHVFDSG
jgi:hypothetical protein